MSWTDDRVALLRDLWGQGKTATQIAQALGGVSRNAVIGKAHRLELPGRASPIQRGGGAKARPANDPGASAQAQSAQAQSAQAQEAGKPKAVTADRPARDAKQPPTYVSPAAAEAAGPPPGRRVPLADLGHRDCCFPLGDPSKPDFGFCGARAEPGLPYCAAHAAIAYQPAARGKMQAAAVYAEKIAASAAG
jgi:GcrA cell cycle regulator